MIVGFLRNKSSQMKTARHLSLSCNYYGIKLVYFSIADVNIDKGLVNGQMYLNNEWEKVIVPIPKYIDVNPHLYKNRSNVKVLNYLKDKSTLSIYKKNIISKDDLQSKFAKSKRLKRYGIPSESTKDFEQLLDFISLHQKIVIKPVDGMQGKSVISIEQDTQNQFKVGIKKETFIYRMEDLKKLYKNEIADKRYMMQRFIESRTEQNDPFDCRIHMEKNGRNQWIVANMFIRVGIGQSVVSNINQGGGISKPKEFLKVNYGKEKGSIILQDLQQTGKILANELEKHVKHTLMVVGIDVGIEPDGNLVVFEVNSFPITSPQLAEISMNRAAFYKYMLEREKEEEIKSLLIEKEKKINSLQNEKHEIFTQLKSLKKEITNLKNSNSWKLTKPLRSISSKFKNK